MWFVAVEKEKPEEKEKPKEEEEEPETFGMEDLGVALTENNRIEENAMDFVKFVMGKLFDLEKHLERKTRPIVAWNEKQIQKLEERLTNMEQIQKDHNEKIEEMYKNFTGMSDFTDGDPRYNELADQIIGLEQDLDELKAQVSNTQLLQLQHQVKYHEPLQKKQEHEKMLEGIVEEKDEEKPKRDEKDEERPIEEVKEEFFDFLTEKIADKIMEEKKEWVELIPENLAEHIYNKEEEEFLK